MKTIEIADDIKIWVISDCHFSHNNIIKYCDRPFKNTFEMNTTMLENWNNTVSNDDVVFYLGDLIMGTPEKNKYAEILNNSLNGDICFIRGNHDKGINSIDFVNGPIILKYRGKTFTLGHYPLSKFETDYSIHGHIHNKGSYLDNSFNVSVEEINYTPILIEDVLTYKYKSEDKS